MEEEEGSGRRGGGGRGEGLAVAMHRNGQAKEEEASVGSFPPTDRPTARWTDGALVSPGLFTLPLQTPLDLIHVHKHIHMMHIRIHTIIHAYIVHTGIHMHTNIHRTYPYACIDMCNSTPILIDVHSCSVYVLIYLSIYNRNCQKRCACVYVSFPYHLHIIYVSFPYHFHIISVSFTYLLYGSFQEPCKYA